MIELSPPFERGKARKVRVTAAVVAAARERKTMQELIHCSCPVDCLKAAIRLANSSRKKGTPAPASANPVAASHRGIR
jgi:hypothetical protein